MNKGRWITLFSGSLVQAMQCFVFLDHRPLLARETVLFWGCKAEKSRVLFYCCFVPFLKAHMDQSDGLYISWLVQAATWKPQESWWKPALCVGHHCLKLVLMCARKKSLQSFALSRALLFEGFYRVLENENRYFWTWLLQPHWRMTPILESIQILF